MAGGFEGENPTRRYKWFRPRQAATGYISFTTGLNFPRVGLFNNSTGAQYLVVRDLQLDNGGANNQPDGIAYLQGMPGTLSGTVTPLVPGSAALPGQLWFLDAAAELTPSFAPAVLTNGAGPGVWQHDFPIAILPPGWSLCTASPANNANAFLSAMWEAIYAEELDYFY